MFIGCKNRGGTDNETSMEEVELPQGSYLFEQFRGQYVLSREEWLKMAIEQQKDGLWERNKLGNRLYVRYLYEDGAFVTQIFREIIKENWG